MNAVYYSLVLASQPEVYERQWIRSIQSLRKYNRHIPVHLFLFNEPRPTILDKAEEYAVAVHRLGSYRDWMTNLAGDVGAVLSLNPTLHKLLPLGHFDASVSQVLYLDCDTFFFADPARLLATHHSHHFYAREEMYSKRSVFPGYRPAEIDEDALYRIAAETGSAPIPLYNAGVILLNHGLHTTLFSLRQEFLSYAWGLTLGAKVSPPLHSRRDLKDAWAALAQEHSSRAIAYPSENSWVIEEIALSLTLGRVADLSHAQFPMADVLQNGEFLIYRSYRKKSILVHYFRSNEDLFTKALSADENPSGAVVLPG